MPWNNNWIVFCCGFLAFSFASGTFFVVSKHHASRCPLVVWGLNFLCYLVSISVVGSFVLVVPLHTQNCMKGQTKQKRYSNTTWTIAWRIWSFIFYYLGPQEVLFSIMVLHGLDCEQRGENMINEATFWFRDKNFDLGTVNFHPEMKENNRNGPRKFQLIL